MILKIKIRKGLSWEQVILNSRKCCDSDILVKTKKLVVVAGDYLEIYVGVKSLV